MYSKNAAASYLALCYCTLSVTRAVADCVPETAVTVTVLVPVGVAEFPEPPEPPDPPLPPDPLPPLFPPDPAEPELPEPVPLEP